MSQTPRHRLSPAMQRALRAMAAATGGIDFIWHQHAWVTIHGYAVADTTLRALERRGYVSTVHGHPLRQSRKLTALATAWLLEEGLT